MSIIIHIYHVILFNHFTSGERSAFVFTPEMAYVMGGIEGENFRKFENLCCQAFNALRKHGNTLINLFSLMVPAGMPELLKRQDINYMRDQLALSYSNEDAKTLFKEAIRESLGDKFKRYFKLKMKTSEINLDISNIIYFFFVYRFDNLIHILKHA